jgi:arsenate reductase
MSEAASQRVRRVLVLCTHNSARSQMAEGWLRHHARERRLTLEVHSAGTEATRVKPDAIRAMAEVGIDLSTHVSKRLDDLADPWNFDLVITVCDAANEVCPVYPVRTTRLHLPFPDPSGEPIEAWRSVRDAIGAMSTELLERIASGADLTAEGLRG